MTATPEIKKFVYTIFGSLLLMGLAQLGAATYWVGTTTQSLREINRRLDTISEAQARESEKMSSRFYYDLSRVERRIDSLENTRTRNEDN